MFLNLLTLNLCFLFYFIYCIINFILLCFNIYVVYIFFNCYIAMSDLFLYFLLLEILYCNTLRIFCNVFQKDTNLSEHNFVT